MAWLDTMAGKAKELAGIASKKTSEAVEISKLKLKASQVNTMLHSTYERIGTLVYEQEKTGVDNSDIVMVCITEVDTLLEDISELNEKIAAIKNGQACPNCGKVNSPGASFCSECGGPVGCEDDDKGKEFATVPSDYTAQPAEECEQEDKEAVAAAASDSGAEA